MRKKLYESYRIFIFFCIGNFSIPVHSSITLQQIKEYTTFIPEFPPCDQVVWDDPIYTSFYRNQTPSFLKRSLQNIHLIKRPLFNPSLLQSFLKEINLSRAPKNITKKKIACLTATSTTRLFIWGSLNAAFHSLVRGLEWLCHENIIDNNLHIKDPNHYFIFNGNAIGRSAYNSETLLLLLLLIKENPEKVIYIQGEQETNGNWKNFGLKNQLQLTAYYISKDIIPLENAIDIFFKTLPAILYINTPTSHYNCIAIAPDGMVVTNMLVPDPKDTPFALQECTYLEPPFKQKQNSLLTIQALIKKEDFFRESRAHTGLGLNDQEWGATVWSTLSSPTLVNRTFYNFSYDAFTIIDVKDSIAQSTITLCNRLLESDIHFIVHPSINLITGSNSFFVSSNIALGSTMSLIQGIPTMGQSVKRGVSIAVNEHNQHMGNKEEHIQLYIANDNYTPNLSRLNINNFLHNKITNIIIAPIGTPTLSAYLDYVKKNEIMVLFPVTGNPQFQAASLEGIVHLCGSYANEVEALLEETIKEHGSQDFAFFYQDDSYGQGPLKAAQEFLKKKGFSPGLELAYNRGIVNFDKQMLKLKQSAVDTIGFFSTSNATQEFLRQLGTETLSNKTLLGISFLADASFRSFIKNQGLSILLGARVPNPYKSNLPIVQKYRAIMDKNNNNYDVFSLEGYIATQLTLEVLNTISGPVTKDSLKAKMESLNHFLLGGLIFTFDKKTRSLSQRIWIETDQTNDWIQKEIIL